MDSVQRLCGFRCIEEHRIPGDWCFFDLCSHIFIIIVGACVGYKYCVGLHMERNILEEEFQDVIGFVNHVGSYKVNRPVCKQNDSSCY